MPKVEIYTWSTCPFCIRAKQLLDQKGVEYTEYEISGDEAARSAMVARGSDGKRSVPQIFINDVHIGGCDAIHALDRQGKLDAMLAPLKWRNSIAISGSPKKERIYTVRMGGAKRRPSLPI